MSDLRFPASLRPIVSSGYSLVRGNNIYRNSVEGGAPRQGRDTFYDAVPFSVALITSSLGRQAFYAFLNQIDGGANSLSWNWTAGWDYKTIRYGLPARLMIQPVTTVTGLLPSPLRLNARLTRTAIALPPIFLSYSAAMETVLTACWRSMPMTRRTFRVYGTLCNDVAGVVFDIHT